MYALRITSNPISGANQISNHLYMTLFEISAEI